MELETLTANIQFILLIFTTEINIINVLTISYLVSR